MTAKEFSTQAKTFIEQGSKLAYIKLALDVRHKLVSTSSSPNYRGLREVKDFIDLNPTVKDIPNVWKYVRNLAPYKIES